MARMFLAHCFALAALGVCVPALHAQDHLLDDLYGRGVHAYFSRNYQDAHRLLSEAVTSGSQDPRVYYFRALADNRLSKPEDAASDLKKATELEFGGDQPVQVSKSLERIQGSERLMIEDARSKARITIRNAAEARAKVRYENRIKAEAAVLRNPPAPAAEAPAVAPAAAADKTDPFGTGTPDAAPAATPAKPAAEAPAEKPAAPAEKPAAPAKPAAEDPFGDAPAKPAAPAAEKPATPAAEEKPAAPAKPAAEDPFGDAPAKPAAPAPEKPAAPAAEEKPAAPAKPAAEDPFGDAPAKPAAPAAEKPATPAAEEKPAEEEKPAAEGKVASRFVDHGDYLEDTTTKLLWQKDGATAGKRSFQGAGDYAKTLKLGGMTGWRVPTRAELAGIFPADKPFLNSKYNPNKCCDGPTEFATFWTSEIDASQENYAYIYNWYEKGGGNNVGMGNPGYIRCVHDAAAAVAEKPAAAAAPAATPAAPATKPAADDPFSDAPAKPAAPAEAKPAAPAATPAAPATKPAADDPFGDAPAKPAAPAEAKPAAPAAPVAPAAPKTPVAKPAAADPFADDPPPAKPAAGKDPAKPAAKAPDDDPFK